MEAGRHHVMLAKLRHCMQPVIGLHGGGGVLLTGFAEDNVENKDVYCGRMHLAKAAVLSSNE